MIDLGTAVYIWGFYKGLVLFAPIFVFCMLTFTMKFTQFGK